MVFLNESSIIYTAMAAVTTNVTGSWLITLLFITLLIMVFAFSFRIPLEFTAIIIFPLLIGFGAMTGAYMAVLGVGIIYLSVIIVKNVFFLR